MIDQHFEGNMSEFSRVSKVPLGTIGHYVRPGTDGRFPSVNQAEKIIEALPKEERIDLVMAMIADIVPRTFLEQVDIREKGFKGETVPISNLNKLPDPGALEYLGNLAAESTEIRNLVEAMAAAIRSSRPG